MSATPKKKYLQMSLLILEGDTLEAVSAKVSGMVTRATREGFDTAKADEERLVYFACERMETQEEADARENDPREIERAMVAKTRMELDRIARKYSLEQLEKL